MKYTYSSNNSGGRWWLDDDQWKALERDGWDVHWEKDCEDSFYKPDKDGRWLGALATEATGEFESEALAIAHWEHSTGACFTDTGCPCCGEPHYMYEARQ